MIKHPLAISKNQKQIYVDLVASPAGKQIASTPHLAQLAQQALAKETISGTEVTIQHDMGRIIGTSEVVKTTDKDAVFYAKAAGNQEFMRYVKNRSYTPSKYLSLVLQKQDDGYLLIAIMIGRHHPQLPDSPLATADSSDYWADHASIWEPRIAQLQTLTKVCPWLAPTTVA